jgi:hypothetical protein
VRRGRDALLAAALALACGGEEPRAACDPSPPPGALGSVCGFANPEDVAWVPAARLLLVSQMRHRDDAPGGSLAALSLGPAGEPIAPARRLWPTAESAAGSDPERLAPVGDPACEHPPVSTRFAPHGIAVGAPGPDGGIPVAVVGHGDREAIERFVLHGEGEAATLRWIGCLPLPEHAVGNDVWLDEAGGVWVTNYQPALGGLRGLYHTIVGGLGLPTGEVLRWTRSSWKAIPGTRGANPNGLLLLPGDETLAVAFTGTGSLGLRPLAPGGGIARDVETGGHPDNLSLDARGSVLVAVHTSGLAFLRCRFGALPCAAPWKLMAIAPATGEVSEILSHDGRVLGGVSSVAPVGDRLYFGAVFDDRIGVWKPPD